MSPTSRPDDAASDASALWRGAVAHVVADPFAAGDAALRIHRDGALAVGRDGAVLAAGPFEDVVSAHPRLPVVDRRGAWILPGLVDLHVHYPQTRVIASRGAALLDWLERYVFPEEMRFSDPDYAADVARLFCGELVRNGTTTALVFGSHDAHAVDLCFREGARRRLRLVMGKVLHGEGVPAPMRDAPGAALDACRALAATWHGRGKMRCAVTPRFALTSTRDTWDVCRRLLAERPDLAVTTHVSENRAEIARTAAKFPEAAHYVDVYERAGLLSERTILAHGIHLSDAERTVIARRGAALAHCPSSNFFLGSGIFDARATAAAGIRFGLGTDVGAGTSFSLFNECDHAYKAASLCGAPLTAAELLWLATAGGAAALGLRGVVGDFLPGRRADAVVVDPRGDRVAADRIVRAADDADALFALLTLCRGSVVRETLLDGIPDVAPSPEVTSA